MKKENNKSSPKISVIITCYNYGQYLEDAIISVVNQTFINWELIIIDDCSTDKYTQDKINFLKKRLILDNFINPNQFKIIQNKINKGVCWSRNHAAKKAKGEYILFLDADDKLKPDCLEKTYSKAQDNYDIVGCLVETFGRENKKEDPRKADLETILWQGNCYATFLIGKKLFLSLGGFNKDFKKGAEDFEFWCRIVDQDKKPYFIQEHLLLYRKHDKEISRQDQVTAEIGKELNLMTFSNNPNAFKKYILELRRDKRKLRTRINQLLIVINFLVLLNIIQILL